MFEQFDVIIIGAGQAGPALAARCGKQGLKTALIERGELGGTCVNNGCVPTKTLIASARVAAQMRRAAEFGVMIDGASRVDMPTVKARKDTIVEASRSGLGKCHWSLPSRMERIPRRQGRRHQRWAVPRHLSGVLPDRYRCCCCCGLEPSIEAAGIRRHDGE